MILDSMFCLGERDEYQKLAVEQQNMNPDELFKAAWDEKLGPRSEEESPWLVTPRMCSRSEMNSKTLSVKKDKNSRETENEKDARVGAAAPVRGRAPGPAVAPAAEGPQATAPATTEAPEHAKGGKEKTKGKGGKGQKSKTSKKVNRGEKGGKHGDGKGKGYKKGKGAKDYWYQH